MKASFIALFTAFCLLMAPFAHASGVGCTETSKVCTEQPGKGKAHDSTLTGHMHHCGHCSNPGDAIAMPGIESIEISGSASFNLRKPDHFASLTVGPLLEPPSLHLA